MAAHTKSELAALSLLEEGLEAAHTRTPGVWPSRDSVARAHREMLTLQEHAREVSATPEAEAGSDRIAWTPVLVVGALVLLAITAILWLAA